MPLGHPGLPEVQKPGLVEVQLQSVAPQSPLQHRLHALRVVLSFKPEDRVVRVPHELCFASQSRFHFLGEPPVEHVVQIDIAQ